MSHNDGSQSRSAEVTVLHAAEEHLRPGAISGAMVHSQFIIECCIEGQGTVYINDVPFSIKAGDAYVLLPGNTIRFSCSQEDPRGGYWCALEGFYVEQTLKKAGVSATDPFLPPAVYEPVRYWLQQLSEQWACKDAGAQLRQTGCAYGLLGAVLQNRPAPNNNGIIDKVIGYMQANYSEDLTLDLLAAQAGLERSYFSSLFKQKTGQSPHSYLSRLRVRKACQLLGDRKYTVSEISYLVGLTPHNFSRKFRQYTGMTAKTYQELLVKGYIPDPKEE